MASFPNESLEYRQRRNRLLQQETELRRMTELVAAARRALPPGGVVQEDYIFDGHRDAAQRWKGLTCRQPRVHAPRLLQCTLRRERQIGPNVRVPLLDPLEVSAHQLLRGNLSPAQEIADLIARETCKLHQFDPCSVVLCQ